MGELIKSKHIGSHSYHNYYLFQYFSAIGFSLSVITCITTLKLSSSFH